jgi:hypothetical protein
MADPEDGLIKGEHLDEGVVHAWLDGQLTAADAARIETHIAGCADCAAMIAEARGFIAASSRILTGLDGVPARVVPRSRSRARIWQVRAAAAVIVVALGAAAVLSDPGGRLAQLRRGTAVPQPAVAPQAFARARGADTGAAAPATPASPPAPSLVERAATPAPVPQQDKPHASERHDDRKETEQDNKKRMARNERDAVAGAGAMQAGAMQAGAMRKAGPPQASNAVRPSADAAQAVTSGAQSVPPARQDTLIPAPPSASPSALAAKTAPSAVEGYSTHQPLADSVARANMASAFGVRRLTSNAAYRQCAGKVVTVSGPAATSEGPAARLTTVRLDSLAQSPPLRGFVVASPGGRANLDGWWVPAGADSAVVSLANPKPVSGALAADSAIAARAAAIPATVTRVQCQSP